MKQRTAVLLTTALTAFVIVVTLGVASATSLRSLESTSAQPATDSATSEISAIAEIPATATPVAATATPQTPEVAAQPVVTQPADEQQSTARPELVSYEGTPAYEIKYDGGVMYVDARTGAILYDTQLAALAAQLELQARAEQSRGDTSSRLFFESDEDHDESDEIVVADTGVGIPPEALSRIFDRFYRVDKARARSQGGSGLGLALVRDLVEANEGSIHVTSKPEAGTVFTVHLPAQRGA